MWLKTLIYLRISSQHIPYKVVIKIKQQQNYKSDLGACRSLFSFRFDDSLHKQHLKDRFFLLNLILMKFNSFSSSLLWTLVHVSFAVVFNLVLSFSKGIFPHIGAIFAGFVNFNMLGKNCEKDDGWKIADLGWLLGELR